MLRAAHPGPTVVVVALTGLLSLPFGLTPGTQLLLVAAVLAGQLSIGWSNDLLDLQRDRLAGRTDKPLATGSVSARTVRVGVVVAVLACVPLSFALGPVPAAVHLGVMVAAGWAYNLGLKGTVLSPVPFALAFGGLPSLVTLASPRHDWAPAWMTVAGALLGIAAHILNTLPDLVADERTGIRGWPHVVGERSSRWTAACALMGGGLTVTFGPDGPTPAWGAGVVAISGALAVVVLRGRVRLLFGAAVVIFFLVVASIIVRLR